LEEHDPSRVEEAKELLDAHKGREEQLMDALNEQYPPVGNFRDVIEDSSDVKKEVQEKAKPTNTGRPQSSRVTGLTLSVHLDGENANPMLEAQIQKDGETGYILSGVRDRKSTKFLVNSDNAEQQRILREQMAKKGVHSDVIEAVVGDASEML